MVGPSHFRLLLVPAGERNPYRKILKRAFRGVPGAPSDISLGVIVHADEIGRGFPEPGSSRGRRNQARYSEPLLLSTDRVQPGSVVKRIDHGSESSLQRMPPTIR